MRQGRGVLPAAVLLAFTLAPAPLFAASDLPWTDANPLEGSGTHRAKPKPERKAEAPSKADMREPATKAEPTAAPVPAPTPTPSPAPAPTAAEPAKAIPAEVPIPAPDPRSEPLPEASKVAEPEAPAVPEVPAPTSGTAKPADAIPVPETRPSAPTASKPGPIEGQGGTEPPKADDAPNSTEKLKAREPVIDPATSVVAAAAIEDAKACEAELKRRGAEFTVGESISEGECGVLRPVSIQRLSSGVKVGPSTQILCRAALALDVWMTDAVAPAASREFPGRKLTEFRQASTYVCRPRASESGISEHSRGSAVDIGAFVFDKGAEVGIAAQAPDTPEDRFLKAVREGACGPFKTVLGPGTDPDHATHFHLDIAARKNGATYCK